MNSFANTQRTITIGYGPGYAAAAVWNDIQSKLIIPTEIVSISAAQRYNPALILLDHHLLREMEYSQWVEEFPEAIFLATESMEIDTDLILTNSLPYRQTIKLIEMACYQWVLKSEKTDRARLQDTSFRYLNKLADISISLSAEDDLMTLLTKILSEGQNIACCDAASLYLINEINDHERELVFKLTQNDSMDLPFQEMRFPMDESSIAGYVALSDSELNDLRDVDQMLVTGGLTKIAGNLTHTFNLYHADEDPEKPDGGEHNGREFTGVAYSLLYRMNAQHTPYLRASIQDVEHDANHPVFFNTTRNDDMETLAVGWFWQLQ